MSVAELTEPSYMNGYAHSGGESANPGLWPTHAWVPRLGPTGDQVFEVNRGAAMTMESMTPAAGWQIDEKGYNITSDGTGQDNLSTVNTFSQGGLAQFSFVAVFKASTWFSIGGIFGRGGISGGSDGKIYLGCGNIENQLRFHTDGATNAINTVTATPNAAWFDDNWHCVAGVQRHNTSRFIYVDGLQEGTTTNVVGSLACAGATQWEMCTIVDTEFAGSVGAGLFYDRALTNNEIKQISDDIMAPFRRAAE